MRIIEIVATRCQILRLTCTKFDLGCASDPVGGACSAPPDPLAGFKGPGSGEGKWREGRGGRFPTGSSDSLPPGCRGARIFSGLVKTVSHDVHYVAVIVQK